MFMNKILKTWKLSITETNSHHTVLTFKSFIYLSNMSWKNVTYFHGQKQAKMLTFVMYSSPISCKRKKFILNKCIILCKPGFVLIQKWCKILCKKHFEQKRETVGQKNLLFCGNPFSTNSFFKKWKFKLRKNNH